MGGEVGCLLFCDDASARAFVPTRSARPSSIHQCCPNLLKPLVWFKPVDVWWWVRHKQEVLVCIFVHHLAKKLCHREQAAIMWWPNCLLTEPFKIVSVVLECYVQNQPAQKALWYRIVFTGTKATQPPAWHYCIARNIDWWVARCPFAPVLKYLRAKREGEQSHSGF